MQTTSCDKQTYLHYPETMKLTNQEEAFAESMIKCGSNKQKMRHHLMADREATVPLKTLHNLQTKLNVNAKNSENELESLVLEMEKVLGARIKLAHMKKITSSAYFFKMTVWRKFSKNTRK